MIKFTPNVIRAAMGRPKPLTIVLAATGTILDKMVVGEHYTFVIATLDRKHRWKDGACHNVHLCDPLLDNDQIPDWVNIDLVVTGWDDPAGKILSRTYHAPLLALFPEPPPSTWTRKRIEAVRGNPGHAILAKPEVADAWGLSDLLISEPIVENASSIQYRWL